MNINVATNERNENRPKPQTPWPLVQPLPKEVPNPTNRPLTINIGSGASISGAGMPLKFSHNTGATIIPIIKESRHAFSGILAVIAPLIMPLIPAIRPRENKRNADDRPISNPPIIAETAEKFSMELAQLFCFIITIVEHYDNREA